MPIAMKVTKHFCISISGWYKAGVVMEIMGLIASVGILFAGVATLVMVKHQGHWLDGRGPVAALIPLAAISGNH